MNIAKNPPATGIHKGTLTGNIRASRVPVTQALKSSVVFYFLFILFHKYSAITQDATEHNVTVKALRPNTIIPTKRQGNNAISTSAIILFVVCSLLI